MIIRHLILPNTNPPGAESTPGSKTASSIWNRITARETQILTCLIGGMSSPEIADKYSISPNTVANQRASIIRKAGVKNTVDLIRLALEDKNQ